MSSGRLYCFHKNQSEFALQRIILESFVSSTVHRKTLGTRLVARPPYCGIQSSLRVIDFHCGQEPVHTMPRVVRKLIQYVTFHFEDRSSTASLRCKIRTEISDPLVKRNPYPIWFLCRHTSYPVQCRLKMIGVFTGKITFHVGNLRSASAQIKEFK